MEINPLTVVSVIGVASLLIERVFYYKSKYKKKEVISLNPGKPENPTHGERIAKLEEAVENIKEDIRKIEEKLNKK